MPRIRLVLSAAALVLAACDSGGSAVVPPAPSPTPSPSPSPAPSPSPSPSPTVPVQIDFGFAAGLDGWLADYADYPQGDEADIGFLAEHRQLPVPLDHRSGLLLSSRNESDDVFMYVWRPITGLQPGRRYRVDMEVVFASNAPPGCAGAGGAPGEAVAVKIGATRIAPSRIVENGHVRVNFDKGHQQQSGSNAVVIGNIAQLEPGSCSGSNPYRLKSLVSGSAGPVVAASDQGTLWAVIGTDSGFEGVTALYLLGGRITLTPD